MPLSRPLLARNFRLPRRIRGPEDFTALAKPFLAHLQVLVLRRIPGSQHTDPQRKPLDEESAIEAVDTLTTLIEDADRIVAGIRAQEDMGPIVRDWYDRCTKLWARFK